MIILGKCLVMGLLTVLPVAIERAPGAFSSSFAVEPAVDPAGTPSTAFSVSNDTQVPGKTLSPGAYTIRVVDHLSDRMIVRVDRNGKLQSTFLALPKSSLAKPGQGPITLGAGAKSAMRGFVFPDGTVAEFVYPKGEAVGLAKANDTTIPAIDPASEGRSASQSNLSKDDLQMVTLWMLSPTAVGPDASGPGIKAAKYQVPQDASNSQVASDQVPPRPKPARKPVMAALPHTAGELPLVLIVGLLSLSGAGWLTRRRLAVR